MFNSAPFDAVPFGSRRRAGGSATTTELSFENFSLQSAEIVTEELELFSAPTRELEIVAAPRDDGERITGDFYRRRSVAIRGTVRAATREILEKKLDEIKRRTATRDGTLVARIGGELRRARATLANPDKLFAGRKGYHLTTCPLAMEFVVAEPFFEALGYTSQTFFDISAGSFVEQIENLGSAPAKLIAAVNFTAATGVSGVVLTNETTGEEIAVDENLSAGDYLRIDAESREVRKNGAVVDYRGVFPRLAPGANTLRLAVAGTGHVATITLKHRAAFL